MWLRSLLAPYRRSLSTLRVVPPSRDSPTSLALPLCFVQLAPAPITDPNPERSWSRWIDKFTTRGYTCLVVDLDPSSSSSSELVSTLTQATPFPPLVFASRAACIVAEEYVSSHALSGLVLDRPHGPGNDFDYEPHFPVAVIVRDLDDDQQHRLVRDLARDQDQDDDEDGFVRRIVSRGDDDDFKDVMEWMDENGL